jgi:hypothetical protein
MSERSSISLEEVLGDNYYIDKLTSSEYSPAVGDTVTITLTVNDVFGDPASGQTRTVTCTGGQFVSMNGTSITASSSVDVTTSSSGTVTLGLSVSVADNIVVSDGRCDCVVSSLSTSIANIMGFTLVHSGASDKIKIYSNGLFVYFTMQGTFTMSANADTNTGTIPSQYAPNVSITVATHYGSNNKLVINDSGSLLYHNFTNSTSQTLCIGVVYPLKANLP